MRYYYLLPMLFLHHLFPAAALDSVPFSRGFGPLFGQQNIIPSSNDQSVQLLLNQYTGSHLRLQPFQSSGFQSWDLYNHGFFSAKIKLPSDYTAGIVVAFYTTNGDIFRKEHDELDFEFLGNKAWRFQTNMYGNGSTSRGREERYYLWFDPSKEFHTYTILWTPKNIIFYIDHVPIREITRNEAMGADFPSKPMRIYATIWDASDWATSGGKYKVNYKYAPFVAEFTNLVLHGCATNMLEEVVDTGCALSHDQLANSNFAKTTPIQEANMKRFRSKYMYYSYCYDMVRYPVLPPECVIDPLLKRQFKDTGRLKLDEKHHRRKFKKTGSQAMGGKKHGKPEDMW